MTWLLYLLQVNLYLALFFVFYAIFLKRETFFQLNRIYLVVSSILSFSIPVLQFDWIKDLLITKQVQYSIYNSPVVIGQFQVAGPAQLTTGDILLYVYLIGLGILAGRFTFQLIMLKAFLKSEKQAVPFSFFKKINLEDDTIGHNVIEAHEKAHAGQWHSADVMLIEAIAIINWFNPVVYLYKKSVKHIHEFIADRQAMKSCDSAADYAMLLLSHTLQAPAHELVNPFFNSSFIKQRIMMLQKGRSKRTALVKYGLSAPLFILMLILSSATVNNSKTISTMKVHVEKLFNSKAASVIKIQAINNSDKLATVKYTSAANGNNTLTVTQHTDTKDTAVTNEVYNNTPPEFKGGTSALLNYLANNIRLTDKMRADHISGRLLMMFIVEPDGSLSDIHALKDIGGDAAEEAKRVISQMPKWKPGYQNGWPVKASFVVPITFTAGAETAKDTTPSNKHETTGFDSKGAIRNTNPAQKSDTVAFKAASKDHQPIYIVDGVKVPGIKSIKADEIQSITVWKGKDAIEKYGQDGVNGVVVLTMKKKE